MKTLLLVLLIGCGIDREPRVTPLGDSFEGTWAAEVARAAQEWTDVGCPILIVDDGIPVSLVGQDVWQWDTDRNYFGYYTGDDVYVRNSLPPDKRHDTLLHEFGHVLGLGHRDWGVMTATISQSYVTRRDCEQ